MIYGSVCSGVEAATVAWRDLGWKPAWFCEFDKFPSEVLAYHYPDVPNLHDMTKIEERTEYHDRPIDLLVGGTPCQSFSIAGLRKGLDDDRGNLALKFCKILRDKQPTWFVWENVPGVLSSNDGRDFAAILSGFRKCGYGIAYRVLDAQYFGVAQRRRRVFVVGYLGDWRPAAAVLFEQDSLHGNPSPRRKTGKGTSGYTPSSFGGYREGCGTLRAEGGDLGGGSETIIAPEIANCLQTTCDDYSRADGFNMIGVQNREVATVGGNDVAHTLTGEGHDASEDGTGRGTPIVTVHGTQDPCVLEDKAHTLGRNSGQENAICYTAKLNHTGSNGIGIDQEKAYTLDATSTCGQAVAYPINTQVALRHKKLGEGTGLGIGDNDDPAYTLQANHSHAVAYGFKAGQGSKAGGIGFEEEVAPTLTGSDSGTQKAPTILYENHMQDSRVKEVDTAPTISAKDGTGGGNLPLAKSGMSVRRLTPVECERLQGFPDNYTAISWRGKAPEDCPDGPRYKAMGNSMAVPVMRWIGERIQIFQDLNT